MAKTRAKKVRTAEIVAQELYEVNYEINRLKEEAKQLRDELDAHLKMGETQSVYRFTDSTRMVVHNIIAALAWAQKFAPATITVDTTAARKIFLGDIATGSMGSPEANGFQLKTTQTLREIVTREADSGELPDIT